MNYSLFKTMSNSKNDCYEFYTTFPWDKPIFNENDILHCLYLIKEK